MSTSLSKLVNNLSEIHSKKCIDENCNLNVSLKGLKVTNVFGKLFLERTMENVRKHRGMKLVATDKKEINYYQCLIIIKRISENVLAIEMKKIKVKINKSVYLGMSTLDISKKLMYEFWYNYIKPKYQNNAKLCYMDIGSFIIHIKTEELYKDIADDVKKWFDTSDYGEDDKRLLSKGMNKKVIGLMKDELGGKFMKEFVVLRPKTYSYLTDGKNIQKYKGTKKCVIKRILKFNDYKICLFKNEIVLKSK